MSKLRLSLNGHVKVSLIGWENIMVVSMKSNSQFFHLSTFLDSNSFMEADPGQL